MDTFYSIQTKNAISNGEAAQINNIPLASPRFMLDRDQIFYSRAFRRLAGKTQLLAAGQDEILRTRLTHTLEVSQIARSIGQALGLDLDLIEAMVLGHDLGHTPFGHVGERTLHEIMTPGENHLLGSGCPLCRAPETVPAEWLQFLGFKHNLQGLVVAMELEKSEQGRGLNLTEYTLYGIQAHTKAEYKAKKMKNHNMLGYYKKYLDAGCRIDGQWAWSLEALLVGQADEIAQWHHDLEDGLLAGLISPEKIMQAVEPILSWREKELTREEEAILRQPEKYDTETFAYVFTRIVVQTLMEKLTRTAAEKILLLGGKTARPVQARNLGMNRKAAHVVARAADMESVRDIFSYGDENEEGSFAAAVKAFPKQIGGVLGQESIRNSDNEGAEILKELFRVCYAQPEKLPDAWIVDFFGACHAQEPGACRDSFERALYEEAARKGMESIREEFAEKFSGGASDVEKLVLMRTICNRIASMTDADARRAYKKYCE